MGDPIETTKSLADAAKSLSDTTGKMMATAEKAGAWLTRMVGEEAAGLLKDGLFYWRAINALKLQDKLNAILARRQIDCPNPIPLRLAIPFLEEATMEDNETLQERWAQLLANAMDPHFRINMERYFAGALASLSPQDCIVLEKIAAYKLAHPEIEITLDYLATNLQIEKNEIDLSLCSLARQALIDRCPQNGAPISSISTWSFRNAAFNLTEFGKRFVTACSQEPNLWKFTEHNGEIGELENYAKWKDYKGE